MNNKVLGIKTGDFVMVGNKEVFKFTLWGRFLQILLITSLAAILGGILVVVFFLKSYRWGNCG